MARLSSIQRLPAELRESIGRLRDQGRTIDEILTKLHELEAPVSRTALARHVKQIDAIGEEIRRSRAAAEAIVARFGDAPESRTARLNIELMHGLVMKLLVGEDGQPVALDAKEAMFVGTALQKLAQAAKQDVEREVKLREKIVAEVAGKAKAAAEAAATMVESVARAEGLSRETIERFRREILGLAAP